MEKMKKNKLFIGLFLLILFGVILTVVGVFAYSYIGGNVDPNQPTKYWHQCDVTIKQNFNFFGARIDSVQCSNTQNKCGSLFSITQSFALISANGRVEMWNSAGKLVSKDYSTGIISRSDQISMKACTVPGTITIKLYDNNGNFIEQKVG
jgi:hypothetical protein